MSENSKSKTMGLLGGWVVLDNIGCRLSGQSPIILFIGRLQIVRATKDLPETLSWSSTIGLRQPGNTEKSKNPLAIGNSCGFAS